MNYSPVPNCRGGSIKQGGGGGVALTKYLGKWGGGGGS